MFAFLGRSRRADPGPEGWLAELKLAAIGPPSRFRATACQLSLPRERKLARLSLPSPRKRRAAFRSGALRAIKSTGRAVHEAQEFSPAGRLLEPHSQRTRRAGPDRYRSARRQADALAY